MKTTWITLLFIISFNVSAHAYRMIASNTGHKFGPYFISSICDYRTLSDLHFTIKYNSMFCPKFVYYDTKTKTISQY